MHLSVCSRIRLYNKKPDTTSILRNKRKSKFWDVHIKEKYKRQRLQHKAKPVFKKPREIQILFKSRNSCMKNDFASSSDHSVSLLGTSHFKSNFPSCALTTTCLSTQFSYREITGPKHLLTHTLTYVLVIPYSVQFSSVQFSRSVVSNSLRPHGLQRARPPCPSPTPGVYSNSCVSSQ